ncbi:FecR domain-containing protein [Stutzerimonas kirkiae]|uniref:Iron dicitrate transport regulator FecR n=1 Tax=Stutzerimonas kirkiae TaxID=2211392 RepID=A0A4Q9R7Z1_9GAMM|nr:FecR domain-containing protein [Stutzerimonas kirkiae]TBU96579.1 iron dicitrate transport regulator FecR [Stutzerimonas kirkiae]TBV02138.1 iron dicitrate transport regulator FecR [Stutzerimonas kirkiae]TBV08808.1 iron dicitrate transport regulator FecR [Stutzerimonas kirkiae]TBV15643.1 iron dicitrate transport regulator FecR [Stutzerimonas kirkiae]
MNLAAQRQALRDAAQWHARLGAAPDCARTRERWQAWHGQAEIHQWAWQRLEQLQDELRRLPAPLARRALADGVTPPGRRTLLKGLVLGLGVSSLAWSGYRQAPMWLADQRTATGERRSLDLADGTRLTLNTASAVDIRYDDAQRLIVLHVGEILVEKTARDPRPFRVRSAHGEMRALGTRFNVRQYDDRTELSVLEHTVAVRNAANAEEIRVEAGMRLDFAHGPLPAPRPADPSHSAWSQGRLVIDDWRLDRTLAELQRYRPGFIECADEVAGLRLSGAYPLDDTERALAAIAQALPIRIETRTRYWVRVLARS